MKSIMSQNPCESCTVDRQIGNPYQWQCECDRCTKRGQWRNEAIIRLSQIEDILGDEYDLVGLAELVKAKREGRVDLSPECAPLKKGQEVWYVGNSAQEIEKGVVRFVYYEGDKLDSFSVEFENGIDEFYWYAWRDSIVATKELAEARLKEVSEGF